MLHKIIEENGPLPDRVKVIFTNTGREFGETLDFVQSCAERFGVNIVWLEYTRTEENKPYFEIVSHNSAARDGEPFMKMIRAKKYLPNVATRFCTIELKIRTAKRYLLNEGWKKWTNILGIRADEPRRIKREQPKERWSNSYPLFDAGVTVRDVAKFWDESSFDLGLKGYNGKTPLGNCDGCFLKSEANRAALARDYPERFAWWIKAEAEASAIAKQSASQFRRDQSYLEMADFVKNQGRLFDVEGALCQKNEGECTG